MSSDVPILAECIGQDAGRVLGHSGAQMDILNYPHVTILRRLKSDSHGCLGQHEFASSPDTLMSGRCSRSCGVECCGGPVGD